MVGLASVPALLLLPLVSVAVMNMIQVNLLGNHHPLGSTLLAGVVGIFGAVAGVVWGLVALGEGALKRARRILLGAVAFDVLAIPIVMLIVKIATPQVYDRESLALEKVVAPIGDVSGTWQGEWTDPRKDLTSAITLTLTQSGNSVTGVIQDEKGRRWEILEGVASGTALNLFYDQAFPSLPSSGATLVGEIEGDTISGKYFGHERPLPGWASSGSWAVKRWGKVSGKSDELDSASSVPVNLAAKSKVELEEAGQIIGTLWASAGLASAEFEIKSTKVDQLSKADRVIVFVHALLTASSLPYREGWDGVPAGSEMLRLLRETFPEDIKFLRPDEKTTVFEILEAISPKTDLKIGR